MTDKPDKDARPAPDEILGRIKKEEGKAQRGRLKIFFGSSAGVGKTYSMLSAAHELLKEEVDVLVGIVETHQRPHTEELLKNLPALEPLHIFYQGLMLHELDLNAALKRKPDVILIDELAHTNAAGCRHPKRWNDVMELLDAGIDVYTTLNVQHIESLSDIVAGTTGIWVKESIPDSVFDMADDIVLVDIDSDDLLRRLHEGNVYIAAGANKRAADNFFKRENLNALREIALRRTAQRVNADHDDPTRLPVADRLLVCVKADAVSAKLIRATKRLATALNAPWLAVTVEQTIPDLNEPPDESRRILATLDRMVNRLGGRLVTLRGDNVVDEILSYARQNGITKLVVGKSRQLTLTNILKGFPVNRIVNASGSIDVLVITEEPSKLESKTITKPLRNLRPFPYLLVAVIIAALTLPSLALPGVITRTDQALLYLTGIVVVAENIGLGPSLFYALGAASTFHFFFATRVMVHETDERTYIMTFLMMLVTGWAIASQSSRLKAQAVNARDKEMRTQALYELTRKLTATRGRFPVAEVVATYLSRLHTAETTVWMTNMEGHPAVVLGTIPDESYYKDFGALQWCFENAKNAGLGTTTMPSATGFYMPLITASGTLGVLGVFPKQTERIFTLDEITSMETIAGLLASALERVQAGEIAARAAVEKENEKLRLALISSFEEKKGKKKPVTQPQPHQENQTDRILTSIEKLFTQKNIGIG
ncbi:MAG: DUF4118 domain-containing protein, partial [Alphaproteobacteria bacterium]|nr:DUF4118 domain-containing protein [Alphaproteobacteria bacterium]